MSARLTSDFWIQAYFQRLGAANLHHYVLKKGDKTAGAILIKVNLLNGQAVLFQRETGPDGGRRWVQTGAGPEAEIDQSILRQSGFDPDLWVLEVESVSGETLLDEPGLSE